LSTASILLTTLFERGKKMLGGEYEDGEETKSDFLARMILMDRIELDPAGKYDFYISNQKQRCSKTITRKLNC